jgi:hypothetical protein
LYSLAEIDPEFTDQVILLATKKDGQPLANGEGPFRIIAPDDKKPLAGSAKYARLRLHLRHKNKPCSASSDPLSVDSNLSIDQQGFKLSLLIIPGIATKDNSMLRFGNILKYFSLYLDKIQPIECGQLH